MALHAYMKILGEIQGEIRGSIKLNGREDMLMVIACEHEVISPRDAASGLPTGKRQHKPITITKEIDQASPLLMNAMVNNENLTEVELQFWRPLKRGIEIPYYEIKLTNAAISGIHLEMLDKNYPENMAHGVNEQISFCYQKIEWVFVKDGISAEDDWEAPNV